MNVTKKQLIIWIISAILIIAVAASGIYLFETNGAKNNDTNQLSQKTVQITFSENNTKLSYGGQAGKTALELLQAGTEVTMSGSDENAYVTGINGMKADLSKNQYWEFMINGESASIGAGGYTTLDDDIISWQLSTF